MYIITRRDLSFPTQAVQSAHAAIEATKAFYSESDIHPHICLCSVRDEKRLRHDMDKLRAMGIRIKEFYEPDIGNQLTAFATEPIIGDRRHLFRNFQLLKTDKEIYHDDLCSNC